MTEIIDILDKIIDTNYTSVAVFSPGVTNDGKWVVRLAPAVWDDVLGTVIER